MPTTVNDLRRMALQRTLFEPTTLPHALARLAFVQADPIRSPARAQDLTLFQRVVDYRAGDLEANYPSLGVAEDSFVNYGFVTPELQGLMHPRAARRAWSDTDRTMAKDIQAFVRERGVVHPREVDRHFAYGTVTNWFGGSSNASTRLLDAMHYRGLVRVAHRQGGTRCYAASDLHMRTAPGNADEALDALVEAVVAIYAPLPARTLGWLVSAIARLAAPQWKAERAKALTRAKVRLVNAKVDGVEWFWPDDSSLTAEHGVATERVRLLAPFDPVVWDRERFELFWGWAYRFEAYTPKHKRKMGYYALPLLWRDAVIGWANVTVVDGALDADLGFVSGQAPACAAFRRALDGELAGLARFLGAR